MKEIFNGDDTHDWAEVDDEIRQMRAEGRHRTATRRNYSRRLRNNDAATMRAQLPVAPSNTRGQMTTYAANGAYHWPE